MEVQDIKASEFEAILQRNKVVFMDFWANWCVPCKQFASVYDTAAKDFPSILFTRVNVEEEQALAEAFHIQSIPHLIVFKQGIAIYSDSGSMPQATLYDLAQQAVAADVSQLQRAMKQDKLEEE